MSENEIAKEAYRTKMEVMREGSMVKLYYDSLTDLQIRNMTAVDCKDVHAMEPPVPMLFLYSENDKVISAAHVEQYIEELTRRAQPPPEPQRYKLKNSAHCMHRLGDTKAGFRCTFWIGYEFILGWELFHRLPPLPLTFPTLDDSMIGCGLAS